MHVKIYYDRLTHLKFGQPLQVCLKLLELPEICRVTRGGGGGGYPL